MTSGDANWLARGCFRTVWRHRETGFRRNTCWNCVKNALLCFDFMWLWLSPTGHVIWWFLNMHQKTVDHLDVKQVRLRPKAVVPGDLVKRLPRSAALFGHAKCTHPMAASNDRSTWVQDQIGQLLPCATMEGQNDYGPLWVTCGPQITFLYSFVEWNLSFARGCQTNVAGIQENCWTVGTTSKSSKLQCFYQTDSGQTSSQNISTRTCKKRPETAVMMKTRTSSGQSDSKPSPPGPECPKLDQSFPASNAHMKR